MSANLSFEELIEQARQGDATAAAELVQRYEPSIRRAIRIRMLDARLRRVLESTDVCQSVLGGFFVRLALGDYEIKQPEDLVALLVTMAHNKMTDYVRRQSAAKRDRRREQGIAAEWAVDQETPSQIVAGAELLVKFREQMTPGERRLADLRAAGQSWSDIEAELGESAEALRKRLSRAIDRVAEQLGVDH